MTEPEQPSRDRLISGQEVAARIAQTTAEGAAVLRQRGLEPLLAVVFQGEHADAASYRRVIQRHGGKAGVGIREVTLPDDATVEALVETLRALNSDPRVHGVLVQTPLSRELRPAVTYALATEKDVEGITPGNLGRLILDEPEVLPCTAAAAAALIESRMPNLAGKRVVIVNRSPTVGRPLSQILVSKRATVTICASATVDLPAECRRAEVLVVAIGRARAIGPDYIAPGTLVIDVGINTTPDGKGIRGDVDTEAVLDRVSAITPVPGGVGPVTTAMLLANTVSLAGIHGRPV